ncbi:Uncharacterized protein TCM_004117 [Theobroma cacao]|uniref:Uncharacterized protein n=1 Tax=Theobroma cacao TaxID=3641 RepID=A0A061DWW6_THECC|nr:Uncharacterized protein TCM_004117 [Theobroma cacao]
MHEENKKPECSVMETEKIIRTVNSSHSQVLCRIKIVGRSRNLDNRPQLNSSFHAIYTHAPRSERRIIDP